MKFAERTSASTTSALAYCLLLMAFTALGLFVATLAIGSAWAVAAGIGLIACLAGSVTGFRTASRKLAQAGVFTEATSPVSIFSAPLRQHQVDRYLENYRSENGYVATTRPTAVLVGDDSPRRTSAEHREPALLSA